jgi:hypothetical protein
MFGNIDLKAVIVIVLLCVMLAAAVAGLVAVVGTTGQLLNTLDYYARSSPGSGFNVYGGLYEDDTGPLGVARQVFDLPFGWLGAYSDIPSMLDILINFAGGLVVATVGYLVLSWFYRAVSNP